MKRISLFIIFLLFFVAGVFAQDGITVKSFEETTDLDARIHFPMNDFNGKKCALIKVVTTEGDFTFDNGTLGIVKAIHKPERSEWWVYMPEKTMKLQIMHPVYGQLRDSDAGFYWFPNPLKAATTYRMELTTQRKIVTYEPTKIKTGFLIIKSDPDSCQVYLTENGVENFVGTTPFQKKLPYGSYEYRVKRPLYHDEVGLVAVDNTRVDKKVVLLPAFGSLNVTTTPSGATISFDNDARTFTTPCVVPNLPSGEHVVNIVAPRYSSHRQKVVIKDGETTPLNVSLDARFAPVAINTIAGATISINGEQRGVGNYKGELTEGIYDIEVSMASHRKATKQIEVVAKQPQTITLNPTPIYGSIDIISDPLDANITINGKSYGMTPTTIDDILIGDYDVVISKEGCATETRRVTIAEETPTSLDVKLAQGREITIQSDNAGDEVYIDGVKQGVTPMNINLSFGTHNVELRREGKTVNKQITITTTGNDNIIKMRLGLQPQWSKKITPKQKEVLEKLINNMVNVEGGTFMMGATPEQGKDDPDTTAYPVHQVTLSDYFIGKYEVTQAEWKAVMGKNPSRFKWSNLPVEWMPWDDCQKFIEKLNQLTGLQFSLPTEAQWEYAARGGNKSQGYKYSGSNSVEDVAWYDGNSSDKTHQVGTKLPNELGLYDMSGNVCEWCSDRYGDYSSSSQTNPTGPASGSHRVYRGGSRYTTARPCRVSYRGFATPDGRYNDHGFRLVCEGL